MTISKTSSPQRDDSDLEALVRDNTAFALALYQQIRTLGGNLFCSPYSISAALSMTYAGARGDTAVQIAQALHLSLAQEQLHPAFAALQRTMNAIGGWGDVQLAIANALWPQKGYPLLESFLALVERSYSAQTKAVDYGDAQAARQTINTWIEEQTGNRIRGMIPPGLLDASTRLVLTNAIYFQGHWASQFDPQLTAEAPFTIAPGKRVRVPMMSQKGHLRYGELAGLQILELLYAGGYLHMLLLLPAEEDGMGVLEKSLTEDAVATWIAHLRGREVQVFLPRFEIACPLGLNRALTAMGMVDAFGDADFSGMDGSQVLHLDAVLHKAFVHVDEQGTEAASATAVIKRGAAPPKRLPVFRADHPFLFVIRERTTGSILFLGRVLDPSSGSD